MTVFLLTMRQILREPGWAWIGPVMAFPAVFWTFGLGQNAFLTAALFGGFTLLADRRPALAGMLLGLVCYKPHFGLLAPVALVCGGYWRSFLAAGLTVAILVGLSVALFGVETWRAYLSAFAGSGAIYASGRIDYAGIVTPFGAARLLGLAPSTAYLAQGMVTGAMMLAVGMVWRADTNRDLRAETLLSATLLALPLALLYDKLLLLVAIAWLMRDARRRGFLPWEKTVLLTVFLGSIVEYTMGSLWHLPLGPVISLALLTLAVRRASLAGPWVAPAFRPLPASAS
jgi:hypothetical protein